MSACALQFGLVREVILVSRSAVFQPQALLRVLHVGDEEQGEQGDDGGSKAYGEVQIVFCGCHSFAALLPKQT